MIQFYNCYIYVMNSWIVLDYNLCEFDVLKFFVCEDNFDLVIVSYFVWFLSCEICYNIVS